MRELEAAELSGRNRKVDVQNLEGICPLSHTRCVASRTKFLMLPFAQLLLLLVVSRYASAGLQVCFGGGRPHQMRWKRMLRRRLLAFRAKTQNEGGNLEHGPKRNVKPGPSYTFPILIRKNGGPTSKHRGRLRYKNTAPPGNETICPPSPRHANSFDPSKSPRVNLPTEESVQVYGWNRFLYLTVDGRNFVAKRAHPSFFCCSLHVRVAVAMAEREASSTQIRRTPSESVLL